MKIRAITAIRMLFLVVAAATLVGCLDVVPPGHPPVGIGIPSWSPDGERIVFALQGEGDPSRIYVIDADGGGLDRLTDFAATCPAWSPDGRRIALVGTTDAPYGRSWLVAMNADGSGAKRIYRSASYADIGCPAWSPEGERLAFIDDYKITLIGRDGRTARRIAAPAQDVFDLLAWSPNGPSIAYTQWNARRNDNDVYVVKADGTSKPRLLVRAANSPLWSPDGQSIAYLHQGAGRTIDDVYVVRMDSRSRLVAQGVVSAPSWSPDGRLLAVSRGLEGIFVASTSGGRPRRLPIDVEGIAPYSLTVAPVFVAWSPDEKRIAYVTTDALYVAEVDGRNVRRIADVDDA